jgi:hypothetical protein
MSGPIMSPVMLLPLLVPVEALGSLRVTAF